MASTNAHDAATRVVSLAAYERTAYVSVLLPALPEDVGMLPFEDSEFYSVPSATSARYNPTDAPAREARNASGAHTADQAVGETEATTPGAIGVWAIAGPA